MSSYNRPVSALVVLALAACSRSTSAPPAPSADPAPVSAAAPQTAAATATPAAPPAEPDPAADLHALDEAKSDASAVGKTILVRVKRGTTDASTFSGFSCERGARAAGKFQFVATDVDLVRAIPTAILPKACPRVLGKVVGRNKVSNDPIIAITKIYDVTPEAPQKPADGAAFANLDDVHLAGKSAVGKTVELAIWRGPLERGRFAGYDCRNDAALTDFVKVSYAASLEAKASSIGTGGFPKKCTAVRLKLGSPGLLDWNAELVDVK